MSAPLFSRPISPEAEARLVTFATEYCRSMATETVDAQAQRAKEALVELLKSTDVDVLVVVTLCGVMFSPAGVSLMMMIPLKKATPESVGVQLVAILKEAIRRDKQRRTS